MKTRVLLIGGFKKTTTLAKSLLKKGFKVTVINDDYEQCSTLGEIEGLKIIYGDGTLPSVLQNAGAKNCDIAIALTSKDEDNLVACQLCKSRFEVSKTIALVGNPNKTDFFLKMGVDSAICAMDKITAIIEQQAIIEKISNTISFGEGRVKITEIKIDADYFAVDKTLRELPLPKNTIIGCIIRNDDPMIPNGQTIILANDTLILISEAGIEEKALKILSGVN